MIAGTKRVLSTVALATLWLAGAANGQAVEPPTGPTYTNSLGMVLARFEPGTFTMGVSRDFDDQAHPVTLTAPFYVLTAPVTRAQFDQAGLGAAPDDGRVSWERAAAFCAWLSRKEGLTYRLPMEAEWEYVRRNPGNVGNFGAEWVSDWYGAYRNDSLTNPAGPATGILKVIRARADERLSQAPSLEGTASFRLVLDTAPAERWVHSPLPFNQTAVKQSTAPALQGPDPAKPYFTVRFALPIPPDDTGLGSLAGVDPTVQEYHHSPGFEIMPNGDALAIWYSGGGEYGPRVRLVQARLRHGADEFDMPEMFLKVKGEQDISTLQWREGTTNWVFSGADGFSRVSRSLDSGATWTMVAPRPKGLTAQQPITSAFRAPDGAMFMAADGAGSESKLWRSLDNGLSWTVGGGTSSRHSTIVPLDQTGRLLSLGGKNDDMNGYTRMNLSKNWGASWEAPRQSPFPRLGGNQRPSACRLTSGKIVRVGDAVLTSATDSKPPAGWTHGPEPFVALSADNGATWHFKALPVTLKHALWKNPAGTLGYSTVRQAPNGVIHVLTTRTRPCIHYEFNEAWVYSTEGDIAPETDGGRIESYSEKYPRGKPKATWSARICPNGRYLLDGLETHYYENGRKQWEVTWASGRRTGEETLWAANGDKFWSWHHDPAKNVSTWTQWWSNGKKRLESQWDTNPTARDLPARPFRGLVANGMARHWDSTGREAAGYTFTNGTLTSEYKTPSIAAQPADVTVMVGQPTAFSVTASGTAPLFYQWYRNDTAISGAMVSSCAIPATTTNDNGAEFKVTVSNPHGSVTSSMARLTVDLNPPTVTATPAGGPAPLTVNFAATEAYPAGQPLTYAWTFGDGTTAATPNPSHTYTAAGIYTATVTISGGRGRRAPVHAKITVLVPNTTPQQMKISFAGYVNRTEPLTDFPVLLVLSNNVGGSGFTYADFATTTGQDLRFATNPTDPTGSLNYEIELWNPNGASHVWVQVPKIPRDGTGAIWAYWGDAAASSRLPCTTNGATWSNGYIGVWHMGKTDAAGRIPDSAAIPHHGINYDTLLTSGPIGYARSLDPGGGSPCIDITGLTNAAGPVTFEYWLKTTSSSQIHLTDSESGRLITALNYSGNTGKLGYHDGVSTVNGGSGLNDGNWHHAVLSLSPANGALHVDGNPVGMGGVYRATAISGAVAIAARYSRDAYWLDGALDEVRISNVARSADWAWACHMNQASNAMFNKYGTVTGGGGKEKKR